MRLPTILNYIEGKILLFGLFLLLLCLSLLLWDAFVYPERFRLLSSITASNIIFGRMAGLSIGISAQMEVVWLVLFNLLIESIMVLLLYPLFVLSWKRLHTITYTPLNNFLERSHESATKYQPLIKKYGIFGLMLFVVTPFAMTGPVVGSFVGYLMGLSHRMTLFIVLTSTLVAIILWTYIIKNFESLLIAHSDSLILLLATTAGLLLLGYLWRRRHA